MYMYMYINGINTSVSVNCHPYWDDECGNVHCYSLLSVNGIRCALYVTNHNTVPYALIQ